METRKVVIVTSGGQKKQVIETGAETLAQLKADLDAAGIDYADKTFFEGLSKTELTHDESILPRDIPRNGSTTNNLVFMLTTPQKKIKSGVISRQEVYAKIKELGLQSKCIDELGRNFTMCKTDDLISLIDRYTEPVEACHCENTCHNKTHYTSTPEREAIKVLVDILYNTDLLECEEADRVLEVLNGGHNQEPKVNSPYTEAELDRMIEESGIY